MDKEIHAALEKIAQETLFLDTLEIRNNGTDFQEQAVWCIKTALEKAYQLGFKKGQKQ